MEESIILKILEIKELSIFAINLLIKIEKTNEKRPVTIINPIPKIPEENIMDNKNNKNIEINILNFFSILRRSLLTI